MKRKNKSDKLPPVNVNDLEEMIALGYRNPLEPRDPTVWTKTNSEKKVLKRLRRFYKNYEFATGWSFKKPSIPHHDKLIINIYKNPGFLKKNGYDSSHLTFSYKCGQSDIPFILNKFMVVVKDHGQVVGTKSLIRYYKWNGKVYKPDELPFYYW